MRVIRWNIVENTLVAAARSAAPWSNLSRFSNFRKFDPQIDSKDYHKAVKSWIPEPERADSENDLSERTDSSSLLIS